MLLSQSKGPSSTWNQTRVFRKWSRKQISPLKGSERPEELLEEGSAWEEGGRAWQGGGKQTAQASLQLHLPDQLSRGRCAPGWKEAK